MDFVGADASSAGPLHRFLLIGAATRSAHGHQRNDHIACRRPIHQQLQESGVVVRLARHPDEMPGDSKTGQLC